MQKIWCRVRVVLCTPNRLYVKSYKTAVGSKSDVLYWKVRGEEKEYGQEGQKPAKYVMFKDETKLWMVAKPKDISENRYLGKPILWPSPRRGEYMEAVYGGYKAEKKLNRGAASGGNKLAGDVLAGHVLSLRPIQERGREHILELALRVKAQRQPKGAVKKQAAFWWRPVYRKARMKSRV